MASGSYGTGSRQCLNVTIIGAGIAGLASAISLRQAGHRVTVIEQSDLKSGQDGPGPVLRFGPNTTGLLKRWKIHTRCTNIAKVTEFVQDGSLKNEKDASGLGNIYQHPWVYYDQAEFRETLLQQATQTSGTGTPVNVRLESEVINVDPETATVKIQGDDVLQGDLVIAADGVFSPARRSLLSISISKVRPGKATTHFRIPVSDVTGNAIVDRFRTQPERFETWIGNAHQLHTYCVDGQTLLFDVTYNSIELQEPDGVTLKEEVIQLFKDFPPDLTALLEKIDATQIWSWAQTDVPSLPTWALGNVVLVGDAAHPFLAYEAQGAAHSLEDAAALGALLQLGTLPSDVRERLEIFQGARQERVNTILAFTRAVWKDAKSSKISKFEKTGPYTYGHDAYDWATLQLKRHQLSSGKVFARLPTSIGMIAGTRQDHFGRPYTSYNDSTFETASITFEASRTYLQTLMPSDEFNIMTPGNIARATFYATKLGNLEWLGGRGYNIMGLYIHNVQVKRPSSDEHVVGRFLPVLFESLADPILSDREELGFSKIFADIDIQRDEREFKVSASWGGVKFADMKLSNLEPDSSSEKPVFASGAMRPSLTGIQEQGVLHYKYIPATGMPGHADVAYPTFTPNPNEKNRGIKSVVHERFLATEQSTSLVFAEKDPHDLPTLWNAVEALRKLEILKVIGAQVTVGTGVGDVVQQERL